MLEYLELLATSPDPEVAALATAALHLQRLIVSEPMSPARLAPAALFLEVVEALLERES